jgi:hypothetical protein
MPFQLPVIAGRGAYQNKTGHPETVKSRSYTSGYLYFNKSLRKKRRKQEMSSKHFGKDSLIVWEVLLFNDN